MNVSLYILLFFFSSRRRHTRSKRDWSSDVCSSDLDEKCFAFSIELVCPDRFAREIEEKPMLTDPIADMLSRIRNANRALHDHVEMPNSRIKEEIARLLKEEGYIRDYHVENGGSYKTLVIDPKYSRSRERVITKIGRAHV